MNRWLRRIRGAIGMGLTWALVWAPVAVLIGMVVDPDGSLDEMWPAIGAYPGFLGGVVFAAVLGIAARRRRLDQLTLARVAAWGALAGLLVGVLPFTVGESTSKLPLWLLASVVIGSITLLSALSAAGSLALARMAEKRELLHAGADTAEFGAGIGPHRTRRNGAGPRSVAGVRAAGADPVGRGLLSAPGERRREQAAAGSGARP
ncbi:MAG: hypothetical protein KY467_17610 [Gemmatimonadetes bacterium]|nr:hypothetical protein [Gemmatimonadota bacterium]